MTFFSYFFTKFYTLSQNSLFCPEKVKNFGKSIKIGISKFFDARNPKNSSKTSLNLSKMFLHILRKCPNLRTCYRKTSLILYSQYLCYAISSSAIENRWLTKKTKYSDNCPFLNLCSIFWVLVFSIASP